MPLPILHRHGRLAASKLACAVTAYPAVVNNNLAPTIALAKCVKECGFIPPIACGRRCCGDCMGKRKKTGNARSDANQSKSRRDGLTRTIADSGTKPDERHSTTISRVELSASAKRIASETNEPARAPSQPTIYPFSVSRPYFSVARREWRIEAREKWGATFQQEWEEYEGFDNITDANEAYESFRQAKTRHEYYGVRDALRREKVRRSARTN